MPRPHRPPGDAVTLAWLQQDSIWVGLARIPPDLQYSLLVIFRPMPHPAPWL